jgi:hypothetical protein
MYVWTGPNIERPRLLPGAEDLITDLRITHYRRSTSIHPAETRVSAVGVDRFRTSATKPSACAAARSSNRLIVPPPIDDDRFRAGPISRQAVWLEAELVFGR